MMSTTNFPCIRCPNHKTKPAGTNWLHACEENWYALGGYSKADHAAEVLWITEDNLKKFWLHRWYSCPYRRGLFVYKVLPLAISAIALILSVMSNETVRQTFGLSKERITKVEIVNFPSPPKNAPDVKSPQASTNP